MDAMIVIGDPLSSNTGKLYKICSELCERTYFIENSSDLPLKELRECNKIGVTAGASTPERVIKEVITTMSDTITTETNSMADYMDDIEQSLKLPRTGDIVTGEVITVNDEEAIINLHCKRDGILRANEVSLAEGQTLTDLYKVGDEVEVKVIKSDNEDAGIILSKKKLEVNEHWKEIKAAFEDKTTIEVEVKKAVKGGVIAAYKEVTGFIPLSQLSTRYIENADEFIGQKMTVKVTKVEEKRNRAVFSHKVVLTEEKDKRIEEDLEHASGRRYR